MTTYCLGSLFYVINLLENTLFPFRLLNCVHGPSLDTFKDKCEFVQCRYEFLDEQTAVNIHKYRSINEPPGCQCAADVRLC